MAKHFLYLTNDKLVALVWKSGTIAEREVFGSTELGLPAFSDYLAKRQNISTFVVTDLIEEDFRLDTVPHLRGSDQEAVVNRKLSQLYRASPYRHGVIQGREEEGRRDDRVLYHAVTNPELLGSLLVLLESAQMPLEGIYSSPVLSGRLLEALNTVFPHTLLVMIVPDFGLRQTYFQSKQIKFSRLTPIILDESQSAGEVIAAEISRTWQYLDSLRFFASGEALEVLILVHAQDRQMVTEAIRSYPLIRFRFLDIDEVAAKLKLMPAPVSSHAEELLVHLYAQGRIDNHFATAEQRQFAVFKRARFGLFAVTACILAAGAMAAGFNLFQASTVSSEIDRRSSTMKPLQEEYRSVVNEISKQTAASETVRDINGFYTQYIQPAPASPGDFMRAFSLALSEFQHIQLLQLVWSPISDAATTPTYVASPAQSGGLFQRDAKVGTAVAGGILQRALTSALQQTPLASDADPALADVKFQALIVEAAISPFDGDHRKALKDINIFIARLNKLPGVSASMIVAPLDLSSVAKITAMDNEQANKQPDARFILKLVRDMKASQ